MSHPNRVFLIRHGESLGNCDRTAYTRIPDPKIPLTDLGREQARLAGQTFAAQHGASVTRPLVYVSPYLRTVETWEAFQLGANLNPVAVIQDDRLREQEWSANMRAASANNRTALEAEREAYGTFWFRFETGESGADVADRCRSLWRDLRDEESAAEDVLIFTHAFTLRVLAMTLLRMSLDEFEQLSKPPNCALYQLNRHGGDGWGPITYRLDPATPLPLRPPADEAPLAC